MLLRHLINSSRPALLLALTGGLTLAACAPCLAAAPAPLLAQIPTAAPAGIGQFLIQGAAVAGILLMVLRIAEFFKRQPPIEAELEKLLAMLRAEIFQLRQEHDKRLRDVHERIDGAHERIDLIARDLNRHLQELPGQIVDLLHKTGSLS